MMHRVDEQDEIPLTGGRTTLNVVRVGDTARRPPAQNASFARGLLRHLETVGFDGAPRALNRDEQGREVLSWIPGDVPDELSPGYDELTLRAAARLIRDYHDASSGYVTRRGEVACHNDLSPCNFVFRDGAPVAIIDFDAANPGLRAHDLGYAAWLWLDIGNPSVTAAEQGRRLGVLLDAYGPEVARGEVSLAMLIRQGILVARGRETGNLAMSEWAQACQTWVQENLDVLRCPTQPIPTHLPSESDFVASTQRTRAAK